MRLGRASIIDFGGRASPMANELDSVRRSVLDRIAAGESPGYNVLYGGSTFDSFADHPRQYVPVEGTGQRSSAAGRYQFLASTWDEEAKRLGLTDFSPSSQDLAAWDLAERTYREKTGRALAEDAAKGAVEWEALGDQWVSLRGASATKPQVTSSSGNALGAEPLAQVSAKPRLALPSALELFADAFEIEPIDYDPFAVLAQQTGANNG